MLGIEAAARLTFVQIRFREQSHGNNFVARRVKQTCPRHVRGAAGLALTATQTVFDGVVNLL